jgi:hypothetical protein
MSPGAQGCASTTGADIDRAQIVIVVERHGDAVRGKQLEARELSEAGASGRGELA